MNIVIDNTTYTVDQITAIVRKSQGSITTAPVWAGPYNPHIIALVDRILDTQQSSKDPHMYMMTKTLKGALLKTAEAYDILTTSGDVARAIKALEASMVYVEE